MKITFLGAAHEVTGSCTLLEIGGQYALIDRGMEQGVNFYENQPLPIPESMIDYVFLTHAHIDHSGMLPLLYKNGFRGTFYTTNETYSLCNIMLRDSANIQISEAEYKSRKSVRAGGPKIEPIYDMEDVDGLMRLARPCSYGKAVQVSENIVVRFTDIGHLLGSACIEFWLSENGEERKIVFSGDVGNTNQPIINDPQKVAETDYLVIESTYGNRLHEKREDENIHVKVLADYIQRTLDRGGNVIIPSFAVGRTQELLYFIREIKNSGMVKGHDGFKVYVDSPLANEATSVFMQCGMDCFDEPTRKVMQEGNNPIVFDGLTTYVTTEQSKELNADITPKVIIASSGMCDAGRIRHHLKYNLWRKESTVLFVGYQSVGTLGRTLYDGAKKVKLFGDEVKVNAEIGLLPGISGHADKQGLLNWVNSFDKKPKQVFVNHGEKEACEEFARCLSEEHGLKADAPFSGTEYDLIAGEYTNITQGVVLKKKAAKPQDTAFEKLVAAAERLLRVAKECKGLTNKSLNRFSSQIDSLIDKMKNERNF
ncbi:MAG: MBL fold metallo-hydrolase [Oscillospiraceae bacterium]|nr:MBL fold metallo-hydrolase [Oscillospiraceae bacterium]